MTCSPWLTSGRGTLRSCTALSVLLGLIALGGPSETARGEDDPAAEAFFETRIRPVLAEHCHACHGPEKQVSGLRLDSRAALATGGDMGPALEAGQLDESLLLTAISYTDDFVKMPPDGALDAAVVADFKRWVLADAPWPVGGGTRADTADAASSHWAFLPVQKPPPPAVRTSGRVANAIDAFVLQRLEARGLELSGEADRRTLIRRVTFDLIGLPPTPEEIDAFLADTSPNAYENLVDRLLASPHYGERWGRHWLDVARYADTKGYVFQEERRYPFAYTYRDWVIQAFNDDLPYDEFLTYQLAADALDLPEAQRQHLAALGFLTVGRRFLNKKEDIIDDRIDVSTRGLMGLTVSCARCHDHKYDPIPTADYYSLYGVFDSSEEPQELPLIASGEDAKEPPPEQAAYHAELAEKQKAIDELLESKRVEFQQELETRMSDFLTAALACELNASSERIEDVSRGAKLRPELLRGLIARWQQQIAGKTADDPFWGPWVALAALPPGEFGNRAPALLDGLESIPGGAEDTVGVRRLVVAAVRGTDLRTMDNVAWGYGQLLARAASAADDADPALRTIRGLFFDTGGAFHLTPELAQALFNRSDRNALRERENARDRVDAMHPGAPPRAMVMVDRERPVQPVVFVRGSPGRQGAEVPRQFLELIAGPERQPFTHGSGRLDLARAIASPDNPLTARVLVNRVWTHHFGQGLVATPSDFGLRSDPPTHPELLDWLAATFVEEGWSIKRLHRLILLSSTYRQQSLDRSEAAAVDPENALLWKQNRQRLEFEPMRDALLAVAGRLDPTVGGRPVDIIASPFSPRRSVYAFIDRQNLDGLFRAFDLASPDASAPRRFVTTVPQQALFLMNSPFLVEQATRLADRAAAAAEQPADRVNWLFRVVYGRPAEPAERERIERFLGEVAEPSFQRDDTKGRWQYGLARLDETAGAVAEFTPFAHWTGSVWQASPQMPDPTHHHAQLSALGGHTSGPADQLVVRRWVAPSDLTIRIEGQIEHGKSDGDGVRGRIVAGRSGVLGDWVAHNQKVATGVDTYAATAGETIDLVADCRGSDSFDSYTWSARIRVLDDTAPEGVLPLYDSSAQFEGPLPGPLDPWGQVAQVLLLANEFMYID